MNIGKTPLSVIVASPMSIPASGNKQPAGTYRSGCLIGILAPMPLRRRLFSGKALEQVRILASAASDASTTIYKKK
jgi:murein endopeptidase